MSLLTGAVRKQRKGLSTGAMESQMLGEEGTLPLSMCQRAQEWQHSLQSQTYEAEVWLPHLLAIWFLTFLTFRAKMDSIKDRSGMDLTEDIKKRWQEYTEELYKKDLHDPDDHNGVITHLEPDILGYEVKLPLERITINKASGGISNPETWCCKSAVLNIPANLENSAVATGLEKVSFPSNPKERQCLRMLKVPHNCTYLTC